MCATTLADAQQEASPRHAQRLYVSWQDAERRSFVPVGMLTQSAAGDFEFRYLHGAETDPDFRAFIGFPDLHHVYRSTEQFPFFENRLMPRGRSDYSAYLGSLGLAQNADPFEVLARSGGRRATDTVEVVAEPTVDPDTGHASCYFLVRGVRYVEGADDAIDRLDIGDHLGTEPDPGNEHDEHARYLLTIDGVRIGYVPAYLTEFLSRSADLHGEGAIDIVVEHLGERAGPSHFRLLCRLVAPWPEGQPPFSGAAFEPLVMDDPEAGS
jgi:hypothetical protein